MFYYLEGVVTIIEPNLAVVDAGGAGYACHTSAHTLSRLELGKKARLYTYCNIKEDAFDVFGFYDLSERRFFRAAPDGLRRRPQGGAVDPLLRHAGDAGDRHHQ